MLPLRSLFAIGCMAIPTINAFEFTGPDSSKALNLTQNVTITWDASGGKFRVPGARLMDLWFRLIPAGDGGSSNIGFEIGTNLSLASGSYEWDPAGVLDSVNSSDVKFASGAEHHFEGNLLSRSGRPLAAVASHDYAVEGGDFVAGGGIQAPRAVLYQVAMAIAVAGVVGVAM